ncbi:MAG: lysostaphin resistance A-like protein [Clostridium sp.]
MPCGKSNGITDRITAHYYGKTYRRFDGDWAVDSMRLASPLDFAYLLPNIFASYDNVSEILSLKNGSPFAVLLLVVVVGPIAEELLFRGVIYGGLRTCFPVDVSALVSALIFGIYHKNIVQGLYAAAFGIILAYIFEKTQSIWGSTLMHMAFNLSSYLISGISQWLAYRQIRIASIWYVIFYVLCIVVVSASIYSLRRLPNRYDEIRKRNGDVEG